MGDFKIGGCPYCGSQSCVAGQCQRPVSILEDTLRKEAISAVRKALKQMKPVYSTGHCKNHSQPGGCHLHNLQCGYPDCDRKLEELVDPQPTLSADNLADFIAGELHISYARAYEMMADALNKSGNWIVKEKPETAGWDGVIRPLDFKIEVVGLTQSGFNVNPTNAVRVTHVPTGESVECKEYRSQHSNKQKAWDGVMEKLKRRQSPPEGPPTRILGF